MVAILSVHLHPLLLSFHHPVIVPFRLVQRCPVSRGSCNRGAWSRNTCFRTSASSVPLLSYCTCPGLRCLTSLLHCYAPARLFLRVTRPIPHRLPPFSPDSVATFFVREIPENVDAISPRGNAWLLHARPSIANAFYTRSECLVTGALLYHAHRRRRGRPVTPSWYINPHPPSRVSSVESFPPTSLSTQRYVYSS